MTRRSRLNPAAALATLLAVAAILRPAASRAQANLPTGFTDQLMVDGLSQPSAIVFLPDGRLLIAQQVTGSIRMMVGPPPTPLVAVGVIPNVSTDGNERGLLGLAIDPSWPTRPYLYVHHTSTTPRCVRLSRYRLNGDVAGTGTLVLTLDPASRYDLISDAPDNASNHNGGTVRFGTDGMLYASLGEDATACAAQDTSTLRGVILRLAVSGLPDGPGSATRDQITPSDNPFVASSKPNERLVWAFGLRNPFRFQIDRTTSEVFIGDVGESEWEEASRADRGGLDFGWPFKEGPADLVTSCAGIVRGALVAPLFFYDRAAVGGGQAAVIMAGVYRWPPGASQAFPAEYRGEMFLSDYYGGALWRLHGSGATWSIAAPVPGQPAPDHWAEGLDAVSDYAVGTDGALWYCRQFGPGGVGQIRRIVPTTTTGTTPPSPVTDLTATMAVPFPSPTSGAVTIDFTTHVRSPVQLSIHDLRGARVRLVLPATVMPPGPHRLSWDGLDDDGRSVPASIYFARLIVNGKELEQRITLVK